MQKTNEYGLFENHPKNRNPSQPHIDRLKADITKANHLDANPIIVTDAIDAEGDVKYWIVNGSHRFNAARQLKLPFYYIWKPALEPADVSALNTAKSWTDQDWLMFHIEKPAYAICMEYMERYKLPLGCTREVLAVGRLSSLEWQSGKFKIKSRPMADQLFKAIFDMQQVLPKKKQGLLAKTAFIRVLIKLARQEEFNMKRLVLGVEKYPDMVFPMRNADAAKDVIHSLYNYNMRRNRVSIHSMLV